MKLKTKTDKLTSTLMEATEEMEAERPAESLKMNLNVFLVDALVRPEAEESGKQPLGPSQVWNPQTKALNLSVLDFQFSEGEISKAEGKFGNQDTILSEFRDQKF